MCLSLFVYLLDLVLPVRFCVFSVFVFNVFMCFYVAYMCFVLYVPLVVISMFAAFSRSLFSRRPLNYHERWPLLLAILPL